MVFADFNLDISGFTQLITEKAKNMVASLNCALFRFLAHYVCHRGCLGYSIVGMLYCNNRAKHTLRSFTKIAFRGRWV